MLKDLKNCNHRKDAKNAQELFCPQGCCFSLSGPSAESEKKNQLCVLGVSSAAGGETT